MNATENTDRKCNKHRSLFERLLMIFGWTDLHIEKRRRRLALHRLTDQQLKDIGLSRSEIDGSIRQGVGNYPKR